MRKFTFLGVTVNSSCSFKPCLDDLRSKATRAILAVNSRYKFQKFLVTMALKRFDSLILLIRLCLSEVWDSYRGYNFFTWDKTEVERVHLQFLNRLLGVLNITTRNIMVRAELGRYLLTLTLKQWILSNMKETFRKDYDLFWSDKTRQTNKLLTYCMYKNDIIT